MILVHNRPLLADVDEIISELRTQVLVSTGTELFEHARASPKNMMYSCPFHKGGKERKPSFGISRSSGACHCFTCGWAGTLPDLVSQVFGYADSGAFGEKWLSRNFLSLNVETRPALELRLTRQISQREPYSAGFTEEELDSYRWIHPYMYKRGLTDEVIDKFDIGYDKSTQCITFPCYYEDGTPAFIARRSVKTKFFSYPQDSLKPVYASHLFMRKEYDYAVICESILNALTCWKWGLPAVALLGTGASHQYAVLKKLPVRKYILALDPDTAGRRGTENLRHALAQSKLITQFEIPEGYDLNDLDDKVLELAEIF